MRSPSAEPFTRSIAQTVHARNDCTIPTALASLTCKQQHRRRGLPTPACRWLLHARAAARHSLGTNTTYDWTIALGLAV